MGYDTISLGLTLKVPTSGTKNWSKPYLDDFVKKISAHDHTGTGKGVQLGTNALGSAIVTRAKMALKSVDSSILDDLAVTHAKIGAGVVDNSNLADLAVSHRVLDAGCVDSFNIAALGVNEGNMNNDAVSTRVVANSTMTNLKFANFDPKTGFTVAFNGSPMTVNSQGCRVWIFGPIVFVRYFLSGTASGNLGGLSMKLPQTALYQSETMHWPVVSLANGVGDNFLNGNVVVGSAIDSGQECDLTFKSGVLTGGGVSIDILAMYPYR